jgi:Tol biopolymer transport system component
VASLGGGLTVWSGDESLAGRRVFRGGELVTISPSAELIAYTRRTGATVQIHVARVSGRLDRVIARVRPSDVSLSFTPDSARLAFSSSADIETIDVAGTNRKAVAVDGTGTIGVVGTAGGERVLTAPRPGVSDYSPLFSPDGSRIAFARSPARGVSDVYVANADGTALRRLTTTPIPRLGTPHVGSTPLAWSPDGTRLLTFRHDRFAIVDVTSGASLDVRKVGVRYSLPAARWAAP